MRFSTIAAALLPVGAALAQQTFTVTVGLNETLTYTPSEIDGVQTGDTINFVFASKNHTATQSSFNAPCTPLLTNGAKLSTGFQDVANGTTTNFPSVAITLSNVTGPMWFFCEQTIPVDHCQKGMVFAVNPTANKTFNMFQQNALATANSTNTTTSAAPSGASSLSAGGTASVGSAATSAGTGAGATDSAGSPSPTDSAANSAASSASSSPSSSSSAPSATTTNGALSTKAASASMLLGGLAFFVALAL